MVNKVAKQSRNHNNSEAEQFKKVSKRQHCEGCFPLGMLNTETYYYLLKSCCSLRLSVLYYLITYLHSHMQMLRCANPINSY